MVLLFIAIQWCWDEIPYRSKSIYLMRFANNNKSSAASSRGKHSQTPQHLLWTESYSGNSQFVFVLFFCVLFHYVKELV